MPTFSSFAKYATELQRMSTDLTVTEKAGITKTMGRQGQKIADDFVGRDLGSDHAMSGWNRGKPIPVRTKLTPHPNSATTLGPSTRQTAGLWTTLNDGRNQGNASGFAGPGINRVTGSTSRTKSGAVRKVRTFKAHRWNGVTSPKRTADRAVREMERTLPKVADREVRKVIAKRFDVT